ncbi:hypothetical protein E4U10_005449 [Claviceps purpurea]|nr:hypothetical protein E4U10_005449 [Claviceps purpurea]
MATLSLPSATGPEVIVKDGCKDKKRVEKNVDLLKLLLKLPSGREDSGVSPSKILDEQTLDLARLFGTAILKGVQKKKGFRYMRERTSKSASRPTGSIYNFESADVGRTVTNVASDRKCLVNGVR